MVFSLSACTENLSALKNFGGELKTAFQEANIQNEVFNSYSEMKKYPLRVHFQDVGQADSIFIELPDGKTMLIDAGTAKNGGDVTNFINSLGYTAIDYVIATHPHEDHIGGMAKVLKSFDIGKLFMPKKEHTTKTFENLLDVVSEKNIPLYSAKKGAIVDENENYGIVILSPSGSNYDNLNNFSAVVKLTYGETEFLFMGDAEKAVESELCKLNIKADVLKLGHHGSNTSSGAAFLQRVSPLYTIISCGEDNSYGHPHAETLNRLNKLNITYFRTDLFGTISVCADNEENIEVFKEKNNDN